LVLPGLLCLLWCIALHFWRSPRTVEAAAAAPAYLMTEGPYRWSRNPMYVAGMAMWAGWAVFYGSVAVLVSGLVWWSGVIVVAVPYEERQLRARWGASYAHYTSAVPRWLAPLGTGRRRARRDG
jgi:protein-S-isoprenylcysteine O-methyltransferase Ste14